MIVIFDTDLYGKLTVDGVYVKMQDGLARYTSLISDGMFTMNGVTFRVEGGELWKYVCDGSRNQLTPFLESLSGVVGDAAELSNMKFSDVVNKLATLGVDVVKPIGDSPWTFNHPKLGKLHHDGMYDVVDSGGGVHTNFKVQFMANGTPVLWEFVCKGVDDRVSELVSDLNLLSGLNINGLLDMKFSDVVEQLANSGVRFNKK